MWHCFKSEQQDDGNEQTQSHLFSRSLARLLTHSQQYSSLVSTGRRSIERVEAVKLSKRPHSLRPGDRSLSSLIVSQPIKCFFFLSLTLKNNLLIIIFHIYSSLSVLSVGGDVRISRATGEKMMKKNQTGGGGGLWRHEQQELFHSLTSLPFFFSSPLLSLGFFFPPPSTSLSCFQSCVLYLSLFPALWPTLLLKGCQSANVVPEGGLALGLSQHEDLLLGQSGGQRGVLLSQQEVVVRPGHRCVGRQEK